MRRVAVIGCPGSGKSTLARGLRDLAGLPLHYLDMLWHLPDGGHVTRDAFDAAHATLVAQERWVIDGTYLRTLPPRIERADVVVFSTCPLRHASRASARASGARARTFPGRRRSSAPSSPATSSASRRSSCPASASCSGPDRTDAASWS